MNCVRILAVVLAAVLVASGQVRADNILIIVDENGTGTFQSPAASIQLTHFLMSDPNPGGLSMALTYVLPFPTVIGDVTLVKPGTAAAQSDLIRFTLLMNPYLVFYSDADADHSGVPADTGVPNMFQSNHIIRTDDGSFYTPTDTQPGFIPRESVTYEFLSEPSPVPAPPAVVLVGLGAGCVALRRYVGRRATA
jgi:hypothetical protein